MRLGHRRVNVPAVHARPQISRARSALMLAAGLTIALGSSACSEETERLADSGIAPCENDDACPIGEHCEAGDCLEGTGNDCETSATCGAGRECRVVTDCGATRCHGNTCAPKACVHSTDCDGAWCNDGSCADPPKCMEDEDCPTDFACGAGGVCTYSPAPPCTRDDQCTSVGTICVQGECRAPVTCHRRGDCPLEERCLAGVCRDPCQRDQDCGMFGTCDTQSGECQSRCLNDSNCPSGGICEGFSCVPAQCTDDAGCAMPGRTRECQGEADGHGRCVEIISCSPGGQCDVGMSCDPATNRCLPLPRCAGDRGCTAPSYCENGYCVASTDCTQAPCETGFDCVGTTCVPSVCRGDSDCPGGQRCLAGTCAPPSPTTFVTQVRILTPAGVVRPDTSYGFVAVALDQAGAVVPGITFDWQSFVPAVATIDADGLATGGSTAGSTLITASVSNGTSTVVSPGVALTNLGPTPADSVRVTVVNLASGTAVQGALVDLSGEFGARSSTTGADGIARFTAVPDGATFSVTVGHASFDFVSVLGMEAREILIALPPVTRPSVAAGVRGNVDLSSVSSMGQLSVSLSGTSIASPLIGFEPGALFGGDIFRVSVPNPQGGGALPLPLPAGSTVGINFAGAQIPIKDTFYARATTGARAAWSFGGRMPLDVLTGAAGGGGGGGGPDLLSAILPFLQRFDHAVRPVVDVLAIPTIVDANDIDGDGDTAESVPDWRHFASLRLAPDTAQNLRYQLTVGPLPLVTGGNANALITVAGTLLPGVGFVPLGLDGSQEASGAIAPFTTKIAPPHGGLEVGQYAVIATAVRLAPGGLPGAGSTRLLVAPRLPENVDFGDGWLDAPIGSTFAPAGRTLALTSVANADLYHVRFASTDGAWHVYAPAPMPGDVLAMPLAPAGLVDRTDGATATVDALDLAPGATPASVFQVEGGAALGLDRVTRAFSRADLGR